MNEKILKLREMMDKANSIVFFGGAGVSTESGIPDFRSTNGLYNQRFKYPPETILSGSFFKKHPEEFYEFYYEKLQVGDVKPNKAHIRLAQLEAEGKLKAVITQNIDGLHQQAGSKNVYELHGTIHRLYCSKCGKPAGDEVLAGKAVPLCSCGGVIRPDVVLYEEGLDQKVIMDAIAHLRSCDMLIVGGTSLAVYPAAGLINYYSGDKLILINRDPTPFDNHANLVINEKLGEVFAQI
jgi:NAD-dependent deacetylase